TDDPKLAQAIAVQQERVQRIDQGRDRLAVLQARRNDQEGLKQTLAALSRPDANEREINRVVFLLSRLQATDKAKFAVLEDQSEMLLTKYLAATRTRDIEQELLARRTLGRM